MPPALRKLDPTLGYATADPCAVGQDEVHLSSGLQPQRLPHLLRKQRVGGPAIDQEADRLFCPAVSDRAFYVRNPQLACSLIQAERLVENIEKGFLDSSVKAMDGRAVALMLPHVIRLNG